MPPLPEVGRISGQEWPRKIKWELKAQQLGATASDIGVTREIEKHLHEERDETGPRGEPAWMRYRIIEIGGQRHMRAFAARSAQRCSDSPTDGLTAPVSASVSTVSCAFTASATVVITSEAR